MELRGRPLWSPRFVHHFARQQGDHKGRAYYSEQEAGPS